MNWWLQTWRRWWWERKRQLVREEEETKSKWEKLQSISENWFKMPPTQTEGFCLWRDYSQAHTQCPKGNVSKICTSPWGSWFKLFLSPAMDLLWLSIALFSTTSFRRISRAFQVELWTSALITDILFQDCGK